jgi:hypothetical protein
MSFAGEWPSLLLPLLVLHHRSSSASSGALAPHTVLLPRLHHSLHFATGAGSSGVTPASGSSSRCPHLGFYFHCISPPSLSVALCRA